MGGGCFRGSSREADEYFKRRDVQDLLHALELQRPENLGEWLTEYVAQNLTGSGFMTSRPTELYDVVDWRFFTVGAEREVIESSKIALQEAEGQNREPALPHLLSFVPKVVMHCIQNGSIKREDISTVMSEDAASSHNPVVHSFDAAVVFMDASGFTALTERLAEQPDGAEAIGACLNGFFTPLIDILHRFGGDVLKFSGDALTVLWRIRSASEIGGQDASFPTKQAAVALACCCCLEVQKQVAKFGKTAVDGLSLTLHMGVGLGPLHVLQLGGLMNRWEYCAAGDPLEEAAIAEPLAKSGEIVISHSVHNELQKGPGGFEVAPVQGEDQPPGYMLLLGQTNSTLVAPQLPCPTTGPTPNELLDRHLVERYIPRSVLRWLRTSEPPEIAAEMRQVSVVFLSVSGLNPGRVRGDATRTQMVMLLLQRACYALEGSVNKFLVDDKGMLLLACFGLPPLNHYTDDPLRAVLAGARFCDLLMEEHLNGRVGVATGKTWCGVVGSADRREYTVLGDVVNTSARLMATAKTDTVVVDPATKNVCKRLFSFDSLGGISLKGKAQRVQAYEFTGNLVDGAFRSVERMQTSLLSWPQWPGKAKIEAALQAQLTCQDGPGGVVFVSGAPGCGKSDAAEFIRDWAMTRRFALLSGQNMNPTGTFSVPRLIWQEVFKTLVDLACLDSHWQQSMKVADRKAKSPRSRKVSYSSLPSTGLYQLLMSMIREVDSDKGLLAWAPLMNLVLPRLDFGPKTLQAMLEQDEQHSSTRDSRLAELCTKVVESFVRFGSGHAGTVVLLHFRRSTSFFQSLDKHDSQIAWALGQLCIQHRRVANGRPLILCIVSRQHIMKDEALKKLASSCDAHIKLEHLSQDETRSFIGSMYGTETPFSVSKKLSDHIHSVCDGNPYGIGTLCNQLQDKEILQITDGGEIRLAPSWEDSPHLHKVRYPEVLVGWAVSAFERLSPSDQELLKAAAVFCGDPSSEHFVEVFSVWDLVGGLGADRSCWPRIERQCENLVGLGILYPRPPDDSAVDDGEVMADSFYCFRSHLNRHAASMLILQERRNFIHGEFLKKSTRRNSLYQRLL